MQEQVNRVEPGGHRRSHSRRRQEGPKSSGFLKVRLGGVNFQGRLQGIELDATQARNGADGHQARQRRPERVRRTKEFRA
jgi:hypothetical protein